MKLTKLIIGVAVFTFVGMIFTSCNSASTTNNDERVKKDSTEQASETHEDNKKKACCKDKKGEKACCKDKKDGECKKGEKACCKDKKEDKEQQATNDVRYQCPMKCEGDKTYAENGTCPVCKMGLTEVESESKS